MNKLVKPIQILLIGAESKSHALDMFINRKHLFHVVNDNHVNDTSNVNEKTICKSTIIDDGGITKYFHNTDNESKLVKYIDHYGIVGDGCEFDCVVFFGDSIQSFYNAFNSNNNLINVILDRENSSLPPLPIVFINVNNRIPNLKFMDVILDFQKCCIFPSTYEKTMNNSTRDPICGRVKMYNSMVLNKTFFTSSGIYEIFTISFILACYHRRWIMPNIAYKYVKKEEAKLNLKEKYIFSSNKFYWQQKYHRLVCIDQHQAMLTFLCINKYNFQLSDDLTRCIFSYISIHFNDGSFSLMHLDNRVRKLNKNIQKETSMKQKRNGIYKKILVNVKNEDENLHDPQHIKFSTFTERLLNHVKNYKNLDK